MEVNMTKIMLVEDDKSLREIYGVRLLAEGYEITSAGDGEEALAMAVKEHPDLILSDVMMPKISGFDMLDILRATPETKEIKVIMMTALSSEDQRMRGESLGANRYLVKSQVGIEDVVRTVHDVLEDSPIAAAPASQAFGSPVPTASINTRPTPQPQSNPQMAQRPVAVPPQQVPIPSFASTQRPMMPQPTAPFSSPAPASLGSQTINPVQPQPARPQPANPAFTAPRPIVPTPRPEAPQAQPNAMFASYNPAMQPQPIAQPASQAPIQDISNLRQPTEIAQPTNVASMMAQELGNTPAAQQIPGQGPINPPQM